jgi:hypothetical protein
MCYLGFVCFNAIAHLRAYNFLVTFLEEIKQDIDKVFCLKKSQELLSSLSYKHRTVLVIVVYSVVAAITCGYFWLSL